MGKQLKECLKEHEKVLSDEEIRSSAEWNALAENLMIRIKIFQHERLIHLIVTMTMCLLTIIVACALFTIGEAALVPFMLLFVMILILTAAYLSHYFKLENGVQSLYGYYYKLQEKSKKV
ncbi:MAG: hypothetical protein FWG70_01525 [Oscillospiraceae bacterium]|nr:hypothetical protein [Oscillospiraceae bacterium]